MRGCATRELVVILVACVIGPSACFLHGSTSRTDKRAVTRGLGASCCPRATQQSTDVEHVEHRPKDLDQDVTPLVDALAEAAGNVRCPLFYPGHKMGRYGGGAASGLSIHPHRAFEVTSRSVML